MLYLYDVIVFLLLFNYNMSHYFCDKVFELFVYSYQCLHHIFILFILTSLIYEKASKKKHFQIVLKNNYSDRIISRRNKKRPSALIS